MQEDHGLTVSYSAVLGSNAYVTPPPPGGSDTKAKGSPSLAAVASDGANGGGAKTVSQSRSGRKERVAVTGAAEVHRTEYGESEEGAARAGRRGAGEDGTELQHDPRAADESVAKS